MEPGAVERLVGIFLCRENPSAIRIRPSRGDGGIDVLVPIAGQPQVVIVYQVKYFHQNLTQNQKNQIERSYRRIRAYAATYGLTISAWYLTMPLNPTNENRQWFETLTGGAGYRCEWRGLDFLEGLAAKYPDVVDYYLHDGKQRLDQSVLALTNYLRLQQRLPTVQQPAISGAAPSDTALQPNEALSSLAALHEILNNCDPHFRYDFAVDHQRPPIADAPFLVAAVQHGDADRCITVKVFARYAEAVVERPIPLRVQIRAEPGSDLHRDIELFHRYGRPLHTSDSASMDLDLPGGLGGRLENVGLAIGPASPRELDYERRLAILAEDDAVLAETLVRMEPSTTGPARRGVRTYGVEQHGVFTLEMLTDLPSGNSSMRVTRQDLTGRHPAELLAGLRFLAQFRTPYRLGVRQALGPAPSMPLASLADAGEMPDTSAIMLDLAEALVTIQEHTATRVVIPDFDSFTGRQIADVLDTARLLRGENLTHTWDKIDGIHLHPGVEPDTEALFAVRVHQALILDIAGAELDLGIRRIDLPAARFDPTSVTAHDDHVDARLIPAGNTLAVISFVNVDETALDS